jgi:hypothetical protein
MLCSKCGEEVSETIQGVCVPCISKPTKQPSYSLEYRYKKLKQRAKHLKRKFDIPFEVYVERMKAGCSYCGANILKEKGGGMDRRDNDNYDYTVDNSRSCCKECNEIRGYTLTEGEMECVAKALEMYRQEHGYRVPKTKVEVVEYKNKKGVK